MFHNHLFINLSLKLSNNLFFTLFHKFRQLYKQILHSSRLPTNKKKLTKWVDLTPVKIRSNDNTFECGSIVQIWRDCSSYKEIRLLKFQLASGLALKMFKALFIETFYGNFTIKLNKLCVLSEVKTCNEVNLAGSIFS